MYSADQKIHWHGDVVALSIYVYRYGYRVSLLGRRRVAQQLTFYPERRWRLRFVYDAYPGRYFPCVTTSVADSTCVGQGRDKTPYSPLLVGFCNVPGCGRAAAAPKKPGDLVPRV